MKTGNLHSSKPKSPPKRALAAAFEEEDRPDSPSKKVRTTPKPVSRPMLVESHPPTPQRSISPETKALVNLMRIESDRLRDEATKMKRSLDSLFNASHSGSEIVLAVATGVDSVLCYMLSFAYMDEVRRLSERGHHGFWAGLIAVLEMVEAKTRSFAEIHAALRHLGVVVRSKAHENNLSQTGVTDELLSSFRKGWRELGRATEEARNYGTEHEMGRSLPLTWAKRNTGKHRLEHALPGKLKGDFWLPMTPLSSSPIEAIRFGLAALAEWTEIKKVKYNATCKFD